MQERKFLYLDLGGSGPYYIDGTDIGTEGTFKWATFEKTFLHDNFAAGQPDGGATDDCLAMAFSSGEWDDVDCTTQLKSICEFEGRCRCTVMISRAYCGYFASTVFYSHSLKITCILPTLWSRKTVINTNKDNTFSFRSDVCDATHDHSCYVIITEALSLAVAVDRCAFMGGHLAVITSAAEQEALVGISSGRYQ